MKFIEEHVRLLAQINDECIKIGLNPEETNSRIMEISEEMKSVVKRSANFSFYRAQLKKQFAGFNAKLEKKRLSDFKHLMKESEWV